MTDNKHRRVWKDEVSKLQYANAVYIDRIAVLERQNADLLVTNRNISNEYEILYHNVARLFGSTDSFTKRGATLPKQLEDSIKAVVQNYRELKKEDLNHKKD